MDYGLLSIFFRKCGMVMRNADRCCRRNGKERPSFAQWFLTQILIWIVVATRFGTNLWILEYGLLKGFDRKCGFQIHNANRFCRRKGKVGPSFASGFLTKMVIYDCSWHAILNETVDIVLWFAQRFLAGKQVSDPNADRFGRRNGKVRPSFAAGCLTQIVICNGSGNKFVNEFVNIWIWCAQWF